MDEKKDVRFVKGILAGGAPASLTTLLLPPKSATDGELFIGNRLNT